MRTRSVGEKEKVYKTERLRKREIERKRAGSRGKKKER